MQKLAAVEEAKLLMNEAKDWGIWHWLTEKRRVRAVADQATDALGELEKKVKAAWDDDLKKAYRELETLSSVDGNARGRRQHEKAKEEARHVDPQIKLTVQRVKEADDVAYQARMEAEGTFDEAERRMSAGMAREGAQQAIDAWVLREKAIRKAEAAGKKK